MISAKEAILGYSLPEQRVRVLTLNRLCMKIKYSAKSGVRRVYTDYNETLTKAELSYLMLHGYKVLHVNGHPYFYIIEW